MVGDGGREIFNIFLFLGYLKSLNNNVSQYFILLQGIKIYKSYQSNFATPSFLDYLAGN